MTEAVYYAIGDVHGEANRLGRLHDQIFEDVAAHGRPATIIHLGDLIDRGARSRETVAMVLRLHTAAAELDTIKSVVLRGNHEQMMLDACDDPSSLNHWLRNGGDSALASYEVENGVHDDDWRRAIDPDHIEFMRAMPTMAFDEERRLVFVHGGIDPEAFPNCTDQFRMWTRSPRFFRTETWPERPELEGVTVIHGHTPTKTLQPEIAGRRINVDSGAVFGGLLTAVVLAPDQPPRFLHA